MVEVSEHCQNNKNAKTPGKSVPESSTPQQKPPSPAYLTTMVYTRLEKNGTWQDYKNTAENNQMLNTKHTG